MSPLPLNNPREAARRFTPKLTQYVNEPLYSEVWSDTTLSMKDRSLIMVSALIALHAFDELPAHLRRARENGVTKAELGALITHLSFYAGFPTAISASVIAADTLGSQNGTAK